MLKSLPLTLAQAMYASSTGSLSSLTLLCVLFAAFRIVAGVVGRAILLRRRVSAVTATSPSDPAGIDGKDDGRSVPLLGHNRPDERQVNAEMPYVRLTDA